MGTEVVFETCQYGQRIFTVIDGIVFYRSTGHNSGHPDMWFPCFGIDDGWMNKGWIIKPSSDFFISKMKRFDSVFFVNPDKDLNEISWDQISGNPKSVLLLQRCHDGSCVARYISQDYQSSLAFKFRSVPRSEELSEAAVQLNALLGDHDLLSLKNIETSLNEKIPISQGSGLNLSYAALAPYEKKYFKRFYLNDKGTEAELHKWYNDLSESDKECKKEYARESETRAINRIYMAAISLHAEFYNSIFQDSRLEKLPVIYGDIKAGLYSSKEPDIKPSERFLNVPLLERAYQLSQVGQTTKSANKLDIEERTKELQNAIETLLQPYVANEKESFRLPEHSRTFEHNTSQGINGINGWFRSKNALLLIEDFDPITLFKKLRAYEHWVIHQKLERNSLKNIIATLKGLGIADKDIKQAICNAETYLSRTIQVFAKNICDVIKKRRECNIEFDIDEIFFWDKSTGPCLIRNAEDKESLQRIIDKNTNSFFTYGSLLDKIIQFFKGLFELDRESMFRKDLNTTFQPEFFSNRLLESGEGGLSQQCCETVAEIRPTELKIT